MFTLYGGNGKPIWEMTPEERKTTLIIMGIMLLGIIIYGIYYFLKKRKEKD